jgi:hypothetical protein
MRWRDTEHHAPPNRRQADLIHALDSFLRVAHIDVLPPQDVCRRAPLNAPIVTGNMQPRKIS